MIFDVSSSQIESLDSKQFVELLKKLLFAEAQYSGISLRGVSVPLQITVPDGGEDARISWTGGLEQTDYLPSRFCIFQSKATDPQPAGWKKEVWTKNTQKNGNTRTLNEAVTKAIAENGAYIGFTSAVLIHPEKYARRIEGIKQGIREAGADPARLKAIEIYDANKIADWVSRYPAIAVWLHEKQSDLTLRSFQTIERLGRKSDIQTISQVEDKSSRFLIGGKNNSQADNAASDENSLTFAKVRERISDYLADPGTSIRILGSSGVGKTRFVYEVFTDKTTTARMALATSAIYCDFRDVDRQIFQIAQSLSEAGNSALIIVDECPRETAIKLCEIATTEGSNLKILTVGNDSQSIEKDSCLNISVAPADEGLIDGIIQQRYPKADHSDIQFIRELSGGYPRIAVLATGNYSEGAPILKSVEDVVERILAGCGINRVEQIQAVECLALFNQLGADENVSNEIDFVAENLARQTGDEMYEHLAHSAKQHLVDQRGCYFTVQPLPIAAFLGARRLDLLRVKTILNFIESAPSSLRASFLSQLRYLDSSKTALTITHKLLTRDGLCGSLEKLKTEVGSECLAAIVHIDPDGVAQKIRYIYGELSIDELKEAVTGKRSLVQVLATLVFRKNSFHVAALLLMRLAAIEHGTYSSGASERFNQLFYLELSGTEAEPFDRFAILDQGLSSGDERLILVCIEALERTLKRDYFVWDRGAERIGNQPPLKAWTPKIWGEIFDFHSQGLRRLASTRTHHGDFSGKCEKIIASHLRSLLFYESLLPEIENIVRSIAEDKGIWLEAIKGIGDWLYFDRTKASLDFAQKVRKLYDCLIPTDLIQKSLLFTKFWSSDIRNPDRSYKEEDSFDRDFEYSSRKAEEVAAEIAKDERLSYRAIQIMVREELNNVFQFTSELALGLEDPVQAFQIAVNEFEASTEKKGIQFLRGLLSGIDKRDSELADQCIQIALNSESLMNQAVKIYTAVNISVERLNEIIQSVREGSIPATECVYFSYGKGLDNLQAKSVIDLVNELSNHGSDGLWTSLGIISMYQYDRATLDEQLADQIRQLVTSKELFEKTNTLTRDGYLFEQSILLIQKHCGIEDDFALEISNQIVRLCQAKNYELFSVLDSNCRNIIRLLVEKKPIILWETLSHFFEIATPAEIHCLKALVGPPEHTFDGESHDKEGILFGISEAESVDWAKVNPALRVPLLCIFYPVTEVNEEGNSQWHPALERLSRHFGAVKEFRDSLEQRLSPSTWSGSEAYLTPLRSWFDHSVPELSFWARDVYHSLERQIARESSYRN